MEQQLSLETVFFVGSLGAFCIAAVMAIVWSADRTTRCIGFWSLSYFLYAAASLLLAERGHISDTLSVTTAWSLYFFANGIAWMAYRDFARRRRPVDWAFALVGSLIWLALSFDTARYVDMNTRVIVLSVIIAAYTVASAYELYRLNRSEPLPAIPLFVGLYGLHALIQLFRATFCLLVPAPIPSTFAVTLSPMIAFLIVESILIVVLTGMAQLALVGQRKERIYRIAAQTDEMTNLCNRRHFLEQAVPLAALSTGKGALILLDLDHFKAINDTFGHAAGDALLIAFADTVRGLIEPPGLFARIGGEEFAVFLPAADGHSAVVLAETIRQSVADVSVPFRGHRLMASVSCGVATIADAGPLYDRLHRHADAALYEAKAAGRNRVVAHVDTDRSWREVWDADATGDARRTAI